MDGWTYTRKTTKNPGNHYKKRVIPADLDQKKGIFIKFRNPTALIVGTEVICTT